VYTTTDALLLGLVQGTLSSASLTEDRLCAAGLLELRGDLILLHIKIDYKEQLSKHMSDSDMILLHTRGVEAVSEACTAKGYASEQFSSSTGEWNVLLKDIGSNAAIQLGQLIIDRFSSDWNISVTIALSNPFASILQLRDAYSQAEARYKLKLFLGCGIVIDSDSTQQLAQESSLPLIMNKRLNDYLYSLDKEAMQEYITGVLDDTRARLDYDRAQLIAIELLLNLTAMY